MRSPLHMEEPKKLVSKLFASVNQTRRHSPAKRKKMKIRRSEAPVEHFRSTFQRADDDYAALTKKSVAVPNDLQDKFYKSCRLNELGTAASSKISPGTPNMREV